MSLTKKLVLLTIVVGGLTWAALNVFQTRLLERIFLSQLMDRLNSEAEEGRIRFDNYVTAHLNSARLIASQKNFVDYVSKADWHTPSKAVIHDAPPPWIPRPSVLRSLADLRYVILLDAGGIVREIYVGASEEAPSSGLLRPSALLIKLSDNQNYMTDIDGRPFLIAAESVKRDAKGRPFAILMIASPLDNGFLQSSQGEYSGRLIALISSEQPVIMASTHPDLIPVGRTLSELEKDYLIVGKSFFDYGSSDLFIGFASFVPLAEIKALTRSFTAKGSETLSIIAFVFILTFTVIMLRVTKRIEGLTARVIEFSKSALGGKTEELPEGDQLKVLERSFMDLTEEVVSSNAELKKARDELEGRVEERTAELSESNRLLLLEVEERKKAESRLAFSEGFLRSVIETEPECVKLMDQDGTVIDMNPAGLAMLEAEGPEQVVGKNILSVIEPEHRDKFKEMADEVFKGNKGRMEFAVTGLKGTRRWLESHSVPFYDEQNRRTVMLSVTRDITTRKEAEDKRKSVIATLNTLVEHMPGGVLLLDAEGRIAHANPAGREYIKSLAGVDVGASLVGIGGRPTREFLVSPPQIMWHDVRLDGRIFEVAGRMIDAGGMVLAIRDVTEERASKSRMELHDRLAAIGQLTSGIAHDFNNILTIITGYVELLLDGELHDDARHNALIIQEAGVRATQLINQILDFSRKSGGDLRVIDMADSVTELLRFIERAIPENIRVLVDHAPGRYFVTADAAKVQQMLANLAVNARDAMPEGGDLVIGLSRLSVKPADRPPVPGMSAGNWIVLTVKDTGTGIPPDVLPHIFEPFFSTKGVGKGVGLGLAQVYGIARQHGGYVDVKTSVGGGSTFLVYLPAVEEAEEAQPQEAEAAAMPRGLGETILIVEDEKAVLNYVRRVLEGLGYKLLTAENGVVALRVLKEHGEEIGLVVTDLVMPEMGGLELCREIKVKRPALKVLALSGYPSPFGKQEELDQAGFEEFIRKPFKVSTLAQAVKKALKG